MKAKARKTLKAYFKRNGYVRTYDRKRRKKENSQAYKKGYEVRFTAYTAKELKEIRDSLKILGFNINKAWEKVNRTVQPLYGKKAVEMFMNMPVLNIIKTKEQKAIKLKKKVKKTSGKITKKSKPVKKKAVAKKIKRLKGKRR